MQWWCAAQGLPWTWEWRAYPGVWLLVAVVALAVWRLVAGARANEATARASWRIVVAVGGVVLLWLTLDWPVGALGAGYLASVHALQYLLLAMLVPILMLAATAPALRAWMTRAGRGRRLVAMVTMPLPALVLFATVMLATHAPPIVDTWMQSQLGAFALDVAWLASGVLFWWPVVVRHRPASYFNAPMRMLYVFVGTLPHLFLAMWLLLADLPVYATYELAPPFPGLTPRMDQQLAGGVLLLIGTPLVLATISVIFFRWSAESA
jgi:cytochrome c oxidase assembly factor CtaG